MAESSVASPPAETSPADPSPRRRLAIAAIFLLALLPLAATPVLPTIDYYNHLGRYYALAHLGADPFLAQNYAARWGLLPNIGLDVIGTGLMAVAPPLLCAKLLIAGVFAIQFFGLIYFNRQLTGRASVLVALLAVPLLYSFIFTWGFANFLLGLGLVLWGAGWWLAMRHRPLLAIPVACLLAMLIFLTHGVAFALYGLLLGGLELGFFFADPNRSVAGLARSMAALAVQAAAPVVLFLLSPTSKASEGFTNADEAIGRLSHNGQLGERLRELASYRLTTILRVSDGPSFALDVVTNLLLVALVVLLAIRGRVTIARTAWPALALGVLLVALAPPALFGVGYVSDRMPLFLAFVLAAALVVAPSRTRLDLGVTALVGVVVAVKLVALAGGWRAYGDDFDHFRAASRSIPTRSVVGFVNLANGQRLDPNPRCEMYGPLLIPLGGDATPVFALGSAQPIALIGRLSAANKAAASPASPDGPKGLARAQDRFSEMIRDGRFDYVLVCDSSLPAARRDAILVARSGRFAVYRPVRPAAPGG